MQKIKTLLNYKPLIDAGECIQLKMLEWRNHPSVRNNMLNNRIITLEEHLNWLKNLAHSNREVMVAYIQHTPIGIVIREFDWYNQTCTGGMYLDPELKLDGLGAIVYYDLLNVAFIEKKLEKLNIQVLSNNKQVISMHKRFGLKPEGLLRASVLQNGMRLDVQLLGITKAEWLAKKSNIQPIIDIFMQTLS